MSKQPLDVKLELTALNLTNPDLMALAWKKAHHYIRSTNWYADNFELDKSALDLHEACKTWADEIADGKTRFTHLNWFPRRKLRFGILCRQRIKAIINPPCLVVWHVVQSFFIKMCFNNLFSRLVRRFHET